MLHYPPEHSAPSPEAPGAPHLMCINNHFRHCHTRTSATDPHVRHTIAAKTAKILRPFPVTSRYLPATISIQTQKSAISATPATPHMRNCGENGENSPPQLSSHPVICPRTSPKIGRIGNCHGDAPIAKPATPATRPSLKIGNLGQHLRHIDSGTAHSLYYRRNPATVRRRDGAPPQRHRTQ